MKEEWSLMNNFSDVWFGLAEPSQLAGDKDRDRAKRRKREEARPKTGIRFCWFNNSVVY